MKRVEMLDPNGKLLDDSDLPLNSEQAIEALKLMLLSKHIDERAFSLQRQGRMGTYSPVRGQEASVVGSSFAIDPRRDWIVPQYREMPALIRHGVSIETYLSTFKGNSIAGRIPDGVKALPIQIGLAAQLPHAVGLAWGLKLQDDPGVVMTYIGDGASSEGDFHEALNLAGVLKAPVVFVLQNNGWAISTPRSRQSAADTFASRGMGYGIESVLVDGNDLFAVNAVTTDAVRRARSGQGPTLIETQTYRLSPHNTADDPTKYITPEEKLSREALDPIPRLISYLKNEEVLDDEMLDEIESVNQAEVQRAIDALDQTPPPCPEALFEHVYSKTDSRLAQQRDAMLTDLTEGF